MSGRTTVAGREGPPQFHRPSPPPRGARGSRGARHEPPVVLGRADPRPLPLGRSRAWDATVHDPVRLLGLVGRERLDALADDPAFLRFLAEVHAELPPLPRRAPLVPDPVDVRRRPARASPTSRPSSASPRRSRSTPAASACWPATTSRRASDLGVPLVGIGLFYRHGYFRQALIADGWQQERYPDLDPHAMAADRCATACASTVDLAGRPLVRPGVAGRRRPGAAVPARHRRRREPATTCAASPTGCTAATPSTGCARRSCSASAACAPSTRSASRPRCSTPTRATPASSGSSASARLIVERRADLRRGASRRCGPATSSPPTRRCPPASTASPAS